MTTPVKTPETQVKRPDEPLFKRLTRHQMFIPVAALVLLVLFNHAPILSNAIFRFSNE